jgi:hypothetical protein
MWSHEVVLWLDSLAIPLNLLTSLLPSIHPTFFSLGQSVHIVSSSTVDSSRTCFRLAETGLRGLEKNMTVGRRGKQSWVSWPWVFFLWSECSHLTEALTQTVRHAKNVLGCCCWLNLPESKAWVCFWSPVWKHHTWVITTKQSVRAA